MIDDIYASKASNYLQALRNVKPNRRTGSAGNRDATKFFAEVIEGFDCVVDTQPFNCLDYVRGKAALESEAGKYQMLTSPYSMGCAVSSEIIEVSSLDGLAASSCEDRILLMHGAICDEQLMPKNFVFYNPEHHQRTIALLEKKRPAAIVTATKKSPDMVGALYPFPLIIDGDFNIPVAYCTDTVGEKILADSANLSHMLIESQRIKSSANNVIARINPTASTKIVVTAHIDAYEDSPGASDNASGTVVLLLLAEMLSGYEGDRGVEIAAFNGEDHYSVGGQMDYLARYGGEFGKILVLINVDDVGYVKGRSAYSTYGLALDVQKKTDTVFDEFDGIVEGEPWFNGDHMIFVQNEVPAIAFTAELMPELMRTITHTSADTPDKVDPVRLVEVARALESLILRL